MARARNIKPGFFQNEELVELPFHTRLLFIGLWTLCDRSGRMEDRPKRIKMSLFPADDFDVEESLAALEKSGFLLRYEIGENRYIQVISFEKHQNPHKDERSSIIPAPCEHGASTVQQPKKHGGNLADSLIPDSLIPDFPIPDPPKPEARNLVAIPCEPPAAIAPAKKSSKAERTPLQEAARETWAEYERAYYDRYGVNPVKNAKIAGQVTQFVQRLGYEESPAVAAFFVGHNQQFYVSQMHAFGLALKDAEKLRTEWATGTAMTTTRARQADRTSSMLSIVDEIRRERGEA